MHRIILAVAACSIAVGVSVRASNVTINLGDTRVLDSTDNNITADTIINNGTIQGEDADVYLNADVSLTNNGTIESDSAAMRLNTPTISDNGLMKSVGPAATIDLNYGNAPVQTITGSGSWNIDNGMNAYGQFDVETTGEFYEQANAIAALAGVGGAGNNSNFSMSNLGGGAGGTFGMGNNSTLNILNGDPTKAYQGSITGGTELIKSGNGRQVLTGNNTYTGGTQINGGVLEVDNTSNAAGFGTVITNTGGTLAGTGNVSTFAVVNSGGAIAPGTTTDNGTLSFFGLRLLDGSSLDLTLSSTSDSDAVDVYNSGTDVDGTTVNIDNDGLVAGTTVWFFDYSDTVIVDENNLPDDGTIDASDFKLGTVSPGVTGHLVSESNTVDGLSSGEVGFMVDSITPATTVPLPPAVAESGICLCVLAAGKGLSRRFRSRNI